MSTHGPARTCCFVMAAILLVGAPPVCAQSPPNDAHTLNRIFGDAHLATNVLATCSRASELSTESRYEFLADWVLSGNAHPTFRLVADFSPTCPAPTPGDSDFAAGFRVSTGGNIVSPALDLIDTAAALDRLDQLRLRVEATTTDSTRSAIDRLALLAIIDIARQDLPSAQALLVEFFATVLTDEALAQTDAALLCVHAAAEHPVLSRSIVDSAFRILTIYQPVVEWSAWQRQFAAAYARARQAADLDGVDSANVESVPFTHWLPASLPSARYRGTGCPVPSWSMAPGRAENLASHDDDFLYYAVPLRGNFEVEWDISAFGWRTSELFVAGQYAIAQYDHESYKIGDLHDSGAKLPITPRLARVDGHIHYRSVVRDGIVTTWVNGRPMHTQPRPARHDPWLAVRSTVRQNGAIHNLKLSGDPVVPTQIELTGDATLDGWSSYFDERLGVDWQYRIGFDGAAEIYSPQQPDLPRGCFAESALFYHRPMLEDGSIEYEFWYDPDVCAAHPALDRLCFLLDPEGVKLHWLTDGLFDRTPLTPGNLIDEPHNRRGPAPLPLAEGDWNHLRLTVRGDTVDLFLNSELIYRRDLEPTNQRHFGLFHYVDRTELRVRNVTWTGDWPREIPEIDAQELAVNETGFLDERLPDLTSVFTHDFAADGLPLDRFAVIQGELSAHITPRADGLHMTRQGSGDGYISATIAPNLSLSGDFDITASFDQLVTDTQPVDGFSSNIFLTVAADTGDECLLMRRRVWRIRDQSIIQCQRVRDEDDETRRRFFAHRTVEAMSGTLRLARREGTVYYLFAENDSPHFRLFGQDDFPTDDLPLQGVRLVLQTHGDGCSTSVVWKNLTVRAERLSGSAIDADTSLLLNFDQE